MQGWNARGTLGLGHRQPVNKPQRVPGLAGVHIRQAAIGGWHVLALDDSGQVWAWGELPALFLLARPGCSHSVGGWRLL